METVQPTLENIRTYFLICGVVNLIVGLLWAGLTFLGLFTSCFLGCLLIALPIIHWTVMVFDFVAASKLVSPTPGVYFFLKLTAVLDIVVGLVAVVPLIFGLLNIQLLARPEIRAYFHRTGSA